MVLQQFGGLGDVSRIAGIGDFIEYRGSGRAFGHSYFLSSSAVNADPTALIRDRGRPWKSSRGGRASLLASGRRAERCR